jgi:DNA-binding transcriptional regulator YiaG
MGATAMREFDALCLPPVKHFSAGQIKKLRLRYKASQLEPATEPDDLQSHAQIGTINSIK